MCYTATVNEHKPYHELHYQENFSWLVTGEIQGGSSIDTPQAKSLGSDVTAVPSSQVPFSQM
jgi:hypothetical protein